MYSLLVVTSDDAFGELIRHSLEETGRYEVLVTREDKAALAHLREKNCPLVFLDFSQDETKILETGRLVKEASPQIKLIVISESGWHATLFEELAPADFLSKPFYTPDLLEMMDKLLPSEIPSGETSQTAPKEDASLLSDKTLAAQNLTRLTFESSAQAALITRNDFLWASAGQLPREAMQELAATLARAWDSQKENDLVRFIRLESTRAEHMLYATRVADDSILALIFDAEMPFGTIRTQVNRMIHSLSGNGTNEPIVQPRIDDDIPVAPISEILSDIPSPNPGLSFSPDEEEDLDETGTAIPLPPLGIPRFSRGTPAESPRKYAFIPDEEDVPVDDLDKTIESLAATQRSRSRREVSLDEEVTEKRRTPAAGMARKIVLEPVSPSVYNLDYACLLIPRLTNHHLTGGLLDRLGVWVPHICVAFGWRLEYISIRPDYLQWIVNVAPSTSPGALMRKMRQHTSVKIFEEFRHLQKENPSGDFWAPGYLIMGGLQPPPAHLIRDFITQTRQRQGISLPTR
jgi:putative transposase